MDNGTGTGTDAVRFKRNENEKKWERKHFKNGTTYLTLNRTRSLSL